MKRVVVLMMPTMLAVIVALVGHMINFQELREGGLVAAGILLFVAVFFGWPNVDMDY